ncbi:MAG: DUF2937 family protein [Pseudomonadota bacterium]
MSRFIAFLMGILGAVGSSQAPAFTQQYIQNLTGRVAELQTIVDRFDRDMADIALSRSEGLAQCDSGEPVVTSICAGLRDDVSRYETLNTQLAQLTTASDWERPVLLARDFDQGILESTYAAYEPAVPATTVGGAFALAGFAALWLVTSILLGILTAPFRRDRY